VVFTCFYKVSDECYSIFKLICCYILNSYSDCGGGGGGGGCRMHGMVVVCVCARVHVVKHLMVHKGHI
jgi:hypothetical protein